MKIVNFELEEKLKQHLHVKFNGESYTNIDSPKAQKLNLDPLYGPALIDLLLPENGNS